MDANEYALKVTPAAKSLGILLNKAAWLGKGKQPTVTVSEPVIEEPPAIEEKIEPAAKEESPTPAEEKPESATEEKITEEPVLPLAVETEQPTPTDEAAPSAPLPSAAAPTIDVPVEIKGDEIAITQGDRRYRVRGLGKNMSHELLKVNVLVSGANLRGESGFHVDTLDLYSARQRTVFLKQAAEELGVKEDVIRRDLGHVLLKLEELQDEQIKQALEPKTGRDHTQRGRKSGGARPVARSALARPHPGGLRAVRHGGRGNQQTGELSGGDFAAPGIAAGDPGAIQFRRRENGAHGSGAGAPARRTAGAVLGDDRAIASSTWARPI